MFVCGLFSQVHWFLELLFFFFFFFFSFFFFLFSLLDPWVGVNHFLENWKWEESLFIPPPKAGIERSSVCLSFFFFFLFFFLFFLIELVLFNLFPLILLVRMW